MTLVVTTTCVLLFYNIMALSVARHIPTMSVSQSVSRILEYQYSGQQNRLEQHLNLHKCQLPAAAAAPTRGNVIFCPLDVCELRAQQMSRVKMAAYRLAFFPAPRAGRGLLEVLYLAPARRVKYTRKVDTRHGGGQLGVRGGIILHCRRLLWCSSPRGCDHKPTPPQFSLLSGEYYTGLLTRHVLRPSFPRLSPLPAVTDVYAFISGLSRSRMVSLAACHLYYRGFQRWPIVHYKYLMFCINIKPSPLKTLCLYPYCQALI